MVMGESMVVGGSAGDGRIDDGADLCFDLFLFLVLFICFGGCDLMVDSAAIVGVFFIFFMVILAATIFLVVFVYDDDDDGGGI